MAVYTTRGSSPWGALGSIVGGVGTLTGNPWLSALGGGMSALGGGNPGGALAQALGGAAGCWPGGEWANPAAGSLVSGYDADTAVWKEFLKQKQQENGGALAWLR